MDAMSSHPVCHTTHAEESAGRPRGGETAAYMSRHLEELSAKIDASSLPAPLPRPHELPSCTAEHLPWKSHRQFFFSFCKKKHFFSPIGWGGRSGLIGILCLVCWCNSTGTGGASSLGLWLQKFHHRRSWRPREHLHRSLGSQRGSRLGG